MLWWRMESFIFRSIWQDCYEETEGGKWHSAFSHLLFDYTGANFDPLLPHKSA